MAAPVLLLALGSLLAALASALGALPFSDAREQRPRLVGLADAVAAGLMLGAGYLLMTSGIGVAELSTLAGAGLGVAYTSWIQKHNEQPNAAGALSAPFVVRRIVVRQALHSASEGVAIAVAAVLDPALGAFVLAALALHNIAEGVALSSALSRRGVSRPRSAALCVLAKCAQPVLAVGAFVLLTQWALPPGVLAATLGFASGAMFFLLLTELLPESYRLANHRAIATLVTIAACSVLFLEDWFL